jgi:type VI secretion system protein ImpH
VDADSPVDMTVAFAGLIGPSGVMPTPYTELVIERKRYRDTALLEFLDLFHHRLMSLFYRAWEKYRFPIAFERDGTDRVTEGLLALVGLGTAGVKNRMEVPDVGIVYYAGLIAQRPHSGSAISAILRDYFQVPATAIPFIGMWHPLEPENLTRIGSSNSDLGKNLIAGDQVLVRQSKFRVRLGPLWLEQFTRFLPAGGSLKALAQFTRYLAGPEFDFDVQLVLRAEDVPVCQLSSKAPLPPMLGWTTWVRTREMDRDCDDVVFAVDF